MNKTKLLLLALCAIVLTGCEPPTQAERSEYYARRMETITYKGHDYIVLNRGKYQSGITHDPDCPCREKGGNDNGNL